MFTILLTLFEKSRFDLVNDGCSAKQEKKALSIYKHWIEEFIGIVNIRQSAIRLCVDNCRRRRGLSKTNV